MTSSPGPTSTPKSAATRAEVPPLTARACLRFSRSQYHASSQAAREVPCSSARWRNRSLPLSTSNTCPISLSSISAEPWKPPRNGLGRTGTPPSIARMAISLLLSALVLANTIDQNSALCRAGPAAGTGMSPAQRRPPSAGLCSPPACTAATPDRWRSTSARPPAQRCGPAWCRSTRR